MREKEIRKIKKKRTNGIVWAKKNNHAIQKWGETQKCGYRVNCGVLKEYYKMRTKSRTKEAVFFREEARKAKGTSKEDSKVRNREAPSGDIN